MLTDTKFFFLYDIRTQDECGHVYSKLAFERRFRHKNLSLFRNFYDFVSSIKHTKKNY